MNALLRVSIAAAALAVVPPTASSQAYPSKPVHVIIPSQPGTLDVYVRFMTPELQRITGQSWILEYRAGAGGQIGANAVARAAPDGYTILFTHSGTHATVQYLSKTVLYDPVADFTPISALASSSQTLLVNPSLPVNTVAELVEYAKRNPGKISYATTGVGSVQHLTVEQVKLLTGTDMVHVPYKGGGSSLAAVVAGDVPLTVVSLAGGALPNIKAGKARILAIIREERYPGLPGVPTLAESLPGFENPPNFLGFFGPARLPRPMVDRLQGAVAEALRTTEVREKIEGMGVRIVAGTPEEFAAMLRNGIASVGKLVKAAGIKPE